MHGHVPFGPSVTLTASARMSTPLRMAARPSFENLISLCAPRVSAGVERAAFAAARRSAREDVFEMECIMGGREEYRELRSLREPEARL
jgi:hypothetical protein